MNSSRDSSSPDHSERVGESPSYVVEVSDAAVYDAAFSDVALFKIAMGQTREALETVKLWKVKEIEGKYYVLPSWGAATVSVDVSGSSGSSGSSGRNGAKKRKMLWYCKR